MPVSFEPYDPKLWEVRRKDQPKNDGDKRPEIERDRSRLIHSTAFRRLQNKTQTFGIGESDFYRTRLTHTMEVAQIGRGIVIQINKGTWPCKVVLPDTAAIEAVCFGHDFGHPPFGHSGEVALNWLMREYKGFEGNGQSLRIVASLEKHTPGHGLNLMRRTLLGILKYPCSYSSTRRTKPPAGELLATPAENWKPPKCYLDCEQELVEWLLEPLHSDDRIAFTSLSREPAADKDGKPKHMSFDASIMTLADDIAYGVHDLEDGIAMGLIKKTHIADILASTVESVVSRAGRNRDAVLKSLFEPYPHDPSRKQAIGTLIHGLILCIRPKEYGEFRSPLLGYRVEMDEDGQQLLDAFKRIKEKQIIYSQSVQTLEHRGRRMIK